MNKLHIVIGALVVVGLFGVTSTGVDLVVSRTGPALIVLGLAGVILSLLGMIRPMVGSRPWLAILTSLGGGYFIWRALVVGPIGLALPDVALVLVFLVTYLAISGSGNGLKTWVIFGLGLLCATHVGVAIAQEVSGNTFYVWRPNPSEQGNTSGLFGHYNPFAAFLNGSIFLFLSYVFLGKNVALRILGLLLAIGMVTVLLLSGSRGGWISFVVGGVVWMVFLILHLKRQQSQMVGVAALIAVVLSVGGIVTSVWAVQMITEKRVEEVNELTGRNASVGFLDGGRMAMQQMAWEIFQDEPIVGEGPRAFSYLSLQKWDPDEMQLWMGVPNYAHNEYLQVLSDYGLVGFLIIILLLLVHFIVWGYSKFESVSEDDSGLSVWQIGAAGGLAAILAQCFFSFLGHIPSCMVLIALLIGILASRSRSNEVRGKVTSGGYMSGMLGAVAAMCLVALGVIFSQSYLLSLKAGRQVSFVTSEEGAFRALDTMAAAGEAGRDPNIFETAGTFAMEFAADAQKARDPDLARKFNLRAKELFEKGLFYNPHFSAGLAGLPRVHDALGNYEEADKGHRKAMALLWSRERKRRPYFYGARSAYIEALKSIADGQRLRALSLLSEADERLSKRREILHKSRELPEDRDLRTDVAGWKAFVEAGLLYQEGDTIWRNARPRNPALAYALMLEAQKRYKASEKVVKGKDPRWEMQVRQLAVNIGYLEAGRERPAKMTEEEIEAIISPEGGLDSEPTNR